jgi:hypothetical protein
MDLDGLGI